MITIIDNFYTDPDSVIQLAKEFPIISCGPAKTISLEELDQQFYKNFSSAVLGMININPNKRYTVDSFFSKHVLSKPDLLNIGWWRTAGHNPTSCRYDESSEHLVFCGEIMLTKDPHPDSIFEIGKVKPHLNWDTNKLIDETCNYYTIPREKYFDGAITFEEFEQEYNKHENNYYSVLKIKNEYNKFIAWTGKHVIHREQRYSTQLAQYFFVSEWD